MDDRGQLLPDKVILPDELEERGQMYVVLSIDKEIENVKNFAREINSCRGKSRVILEVKNDDDVCRIMLGNGVDSEKIADSFPEYFSAKLA